MSTAEEKARWILAHEALGLGRLLTAARHITSAATELNRLLGYLDGDAPQLRHVELGITSVFSHLLNASRALDVVPKE